jgi:hypothetical protein
MTRSWVECQRSTDFAASRRFGYAHLCRMPTLPGRSKHVHQSPRHVRARMRGRLIEPLEDLELPDGQEITLAVNPPDLPQLDDLPAALAASAGAWSDRAHPELATRADIVNAVASARVSFDRGDGR